MLTYGFFNSLDHDRLYDAGQMSSIFDGIIRDGVFQVVDGLNEGEGLTVKAANDPNNPMKVLVGEGRAWFNHTWTLNDSKYSLKVTEADAIYTRIDAVVLEINSDVNIRENTFKILEGEPSIDPVKPLLTHNEKINQYALAWITIPANTRTITQSMIASNVGMSDTPFVTGPLEVLDASHLYSQWDARYTEFIGASTQDFEDWFAHLHNELDENQAGHLQNQIDEIRMRVLEYDVMTKEQVDALFD